MFRMQVLHRRAISPDGTFTHHGNVTHDGKRIQVYGQNGARTTRVLNQPNMEEMLRGRLGIGERGVNAIEPFSDRCTIDISNWGHPDSPYREVFCKACAVVVPEVQDEGLDVPDWALEAANVLAGV